MTLNQFKKFLNILPVAQNGTRNCRRHERNERKEILAFGNIDEGDSLGMGGPGHRRSEGGELRYIRCIVSRIMPV